MMLTPKALMLLSTLKESLTDLSTECWTEETRVQLRQVEEERNKLETLLLEENK